MPRLDDLPISETLAVFLGVSGFEWLSEGRASVPMALLAAATAGLLVYLIRRYFDRNRHQTK